MRMLLGPLDATGRVPPRQQTRVAAFLVSCHGAMARQLAIALAWQVKANWHTELNARFYREAEIVSLLLRATAWEPDPELLLLLPWWEAAWLPRPPTAVADRAQGLTIDIAALGHALHCVIRPAALLPVEAPAQDPFALSLRKIEFESDRMMQGQILFLKSSELFLLRDAVNAAVEGRHLQVRRPVGRDARRHRRGTEGSSGSGEPGGSGDDRARTLIQINGPSSELQLQW
jgi:hypothetical protein